MLSLTQEGKNFLVFGKTPLFLLGKDQLSIGHHLEDPSGRLDQFRLDPQLLLERLRQTGGFGVVVSLHAIFNAQFSYHEIYLRLKGLLRRFSRGIGSFHPI